VAHLLKKIPQGKQAEQSYELRPWQTSGDVENDELVVIYHNWDEIRRLMWDYVSIVRTNKRLQRAAARLRNLKREVQEFYWSNHVTSEILELRNLVETASLIVECAMKAADCTTRWTFHRRTTHAPPWTARCVAIEAISTFLARFEHLRHAVCPDFRVIASPI
jgi:aspartate oxidase